MFDKLISFVLEEEGGYVNHPSDPGGETKFGISKRSYPDVDIKNLTKPQAIEIYRKDYWKDEWEKLGHFPKPFVISCQRMIMWIPVVEVAHLDNLFCGGSSDLEGHFPFLSLTFRYFHVP